MADLDAAVADLLRRTAAQVVVPLFRTAAADPQQKRPGDWVTRADHDAEAALSAALPQLLPGSTVVGEEAVHADPSLLGRLGAQAQVWLIDPVDGTRNFASGREPFAMIVALVRDGATDHGWMYLPMEDRMLRARRGLGSSLNATAVAGPGAAPQRLRGIVPLPAMAPEFAADIERRAKPVADLLPSWWCAGREYPDVLSGAADFAVFATTMPWDHAAGALAVSEAGGRAAYFDGEPYTVRDESRRSMLVARSPAIWERVMVEILPGMRDDPQHAWIRR